MAGNIWNILLVFVLISGLWAIDVSVGAIDSGCGLTNGWYWKEPVKVYHLGLFLVMLSGLLLAVLSQLEHDHDYETKEYNE